MKPFSRLQKAKYKEVIDRFGTDNTIMLSEEEYVPLQHVLNTLIDHEYICKIKIDGAYVFTKTCDFKHFDELLADSVREERMLSRREMKNAILSDVVSAFISNIPKSIRNIIPWIEKLRK